MSRHPAPIARVPRANVDPVATATDALALVSLAITHPLEDETVVIVLDGQRLGSIITVVSGTQHVDVCTVIERFCIAALETCSEGRSSASALVVATVRPTGATRPGDIDRWLEASSLAETFGLDLLEWFVIGPAGPECPRDLIGEPERW